MNNEVPDGCPRHKMPSNGCAFAVYDDNLGFSPGWCQLADESCVLSQRSTNSVWEKSKQGTLVSRIIVQQTLLDFRNFPTCSPLFQPALLLILENFITYTSINLNI